MFALAAPTLLANPLVAKSTAYIANKAFQVWQLLLHCQHATLLPARTSCTANLLVQQ